MYIQDNKVTTNVPIYDENGILISWEVDPSIEKELIQLMPFVILEFDGDGDQKRVIGVKDDVDARSAYLASKESSQNDLILYQQDDIRRDREKFLRAFDVYKSNVLYGIITETEEEKAEVAAWYQYLLDLPDTITPDNLSYEWPVTPAKIDKYIIKKTTAQRKRDRVRNRMRG